MRFLSSLLDEDSLDRRGELHLPSPISSSTQFLSLEGSKKYSVKSSQVSLIRQELVTLVGHHSRAVILNQLLYWTQRTKDFSRLIEEERNRSGKQGDIPQYGWIYKKADELVEETLLKVDRTTIRRYLNSLVKQEWLFERSHPQNKWDRTTQYRVNVHKIHKELMEIGLSLSEISLWQLEDVFVKEEQNAKRETTPSNVYILPFRGQNPLKPAETSSGQNAHSNEQNARSNGQNAHSNTETTSEITNKKHTQNMRARKRYQNDFFEEGFEIWKTYIGQDVHHSQNRKQRLSSLLNSHFQNDLSQWERFCKRIKASPFLMGDGPRKWRVSLDWVLNEANFLKVLEGNFDDSAPLECQKFKQIQEKKTKEILATIEDPVWKEWCTQWVQGIWLNSNQALIDPLSCTDLERIANARFLKVEDERLVWIGSSDSKVLNKIEDLRLPLSSIVMRTFPKSRTIRTCLIESTTDNSQLQKEKSNAQ